MSSQILVTNVCSKLQRLSHRARGTSAQAQVADTGVRPTSIDARKISPSFRIRSGDDKH